ncbi:hypothetical protein SFUMM280S_06930 [Streptomyces fumanus]
MCGKDLATRSISAGSMDSAAPTSRMACRTRYVSGTALATTLKGLVTEAERAERRTVRTVDAAPASPRDFDGLSSFYLVVGWCVGGYLCASILAISTGARPPTRAGPRSG